MCTDEERSKRNLKALRQTKQNTENVVEFRRRNKQKLMAALGGKCEMCGYCKDVPNAYHFHHRNKAEKSYTISRHMTRNFDALMEEAKKCMLLCSNCHAEVHNEEHVQIRKNTIKQWSERTDDDLKLLAKNRKKERAKGTCPVCSTTFDKTFEAKRFCSRKCANAFNYEQRCIEPLLFRG